MQQLEIGGGIVVENYQVDLESFVMKILVAANQFAHCRQISDLSNSHHQDRQVATYAVWPQT